MLQFLTYLLHKQIIEMRRSQNLRCPFSVPSRRLCASPIMSKKPGNFIVYFDFEEDEIVNIAELFIGQNWT